MHRASLDTSIDEEGRLQFDQRKLLLNGFGETLLSMGRPLEVSGTLALLMLFQHPLLFDQDPLLDQPLPRDLV